MSLAEAQADVEASLKTFQSLQRFYRTNENFKHIGQVDNFRGESEALLQLAEIKRLRSLTVEDSKAIDAYTEGAKSDLKTAYQIFSEIEDPEGAARVFKTRGELFLDRNDLASAKVELENGLDIIIDVGSASARVLEYQLNALLDKVTKVLSADHTSTLGMDEALVMKERHDMLEAFLKFSRPAEVPAHPSPTSPSSSPAKEPDHRMEWKDFKLFAKEIGTHPLLSEEELSEVRLQLKASGKDSITFNDFWAWWKA